MRSCSDLRQEIGRFSGQSSDGRLLESLILLFPIAVVTLTAMTFLFGGHCALWQWWLPLVVLFLGMLRRAGMRSTLRVCLMFMGFLFVVWLLTGMLWVYSGHDHAVSHFPGIRLLMLGWNPICQPTSEDLMTSFGVYPNQLKMVSMLSSPKVVWYFAAVAALFTGDCFNFLMPIFLFLLVPVLFSVNRVFGRCHWLVRVSAMVLLFSVSIGETIVDVTVGLAGMGLLLEMLRDFQDDCRGDNRLSEFVYSFWMCSAKPSAVGACLLFWMIHFVVLRKTYSLKRTLGYSTLALVLIAFVNLSPYFTAWKHFGHPFYPTCTVDATRWPTRNLIADFWNRNKDAARIGHVGMFVNAYVSKTVAHAYYKFQNPDFHPWQDTWKQGSMEEDAGTPTCAKTRLVFVISSVLMLTLGGHGMRWIWVMIVGSLLLMPSPLVGFERYVPWYFLMPVLAFASITKIGHNRTRIVLISGASLYVAFFHLFPQVVILATRLDRAYAARCFLQEVPCRTVYYYAKPAPKDLISKGRCLEKKPWNGTLFERWQANVNLLKRQDKGLRRMCFEDLPYEKMAETDYANYPDFFGDTLFRLDSSFTAANYSSYANLLQETNRKRRLLKMPLFCLKTYSKTLVKSIWLRLSQILNKGEFA